MVETKKLIDIADVFDSLHQTPEYGETGIPMVRVTDVKPGDLSLEGCQFVADEVFEKFTASHVPQKGDIVISRVGTYGNFSYVAENLKFCLGQNTSIIVPKINPRYLYYYLRSPFARMQIESRVVGSTQKTLSLKNIKELEILCPDRSIQDKIASFLETIDIKIDNNNKINRNLQEQAQAVYCERFGYREKSVTLDAYPVKVYSGGTPSTKNQEYWDGDIPWLSSGETAQAFVVATDKYITEEGLNNSSTKWAEKYDVVTASAGQGHTRGQTSMLLLNTCINQSVIVTHAEKKYMPLFFFNISGRYDELRVLSDGTSTRGSLTTKIIAKLPMPYISVNEIEEFAEFAWPIIDQIESNQIANSKLNDLRDAILPRLMSGELDVSDIDI